MPKYKCKRCTYITDVCCKKNPPSMCKSCGCKEIKKISDECDCGSSCQNTKGCGGCGKKR